jgi:hypothetical protein
MGKLLIGLVGLIIGAVGGALFGGAVIGGTAAGVGIATGLSAGICSTVTAAEEEGLLTAEQVEQVLARAASDAAAAAGEETPGTMVGSSDDCAMVMDQLMSARGQ